MKKLLLYFSTCVVFLTFAGFVFADPLVQPVRTLEVPFSNWRITVDGIADDSYSPEQTTTAFNATGSTGADADFTFSFRVAFNPRYLFIFSTILDDFVNSPDYTTTDSIWKYDNIEVYISLDTTGSTYPTTNGYEDDSNCVQLRFCRNFYDSVQEPGRAAHSEYFLHTENTASGWLFEVGIPWNAALGEEQSISDFLDYLEGIHGFDVIGNDSDIPGPGYIDCQTAWDMDDPDDPDDRTEDNAWTDRSVFGIITLADASGWADEFVSIEQMEKRNSIYPNPASNTLHFEIENVNTIRIYSLTGVLLKEVETTCEVDISGLKSGMYLAEINSSSFVKFIKE